MKVKPPKIRRGSKLERWFNFYLDRTNLETYMNATASARAAGYKCSGYAGFGGVGYDNRKKLEALISETLGDCGVSRESVLSLLSESMRATKTHIIRHEDEVEERVVADHQSRVPALRLAAKVLGMESPTKHEHTGPNGAALEVTVKPDMTPKEAVQECENMLREP